MKIVRKALKVAAFTVGTVLVVLAGLLVYASVFWDAPVDRPVRQFVAPRDSAAVARGRFLYTSSLTCWQCHSQGNSATAPPSGGRVFDLTGISPSLGMYYSANITQDVETGIGGWTDAEIIRAIREGVRKDGKVLFPIMPVDPLNGLSDDDVLALVAYLRSIPPVHNAVPARTPSLFARTLMTLGVIGPAQPLPQAVVAPPRAADRFYGEYIVRHAALCSDCHTPRNLNTGAFFYDSLLAGSSFCFGEDPPEPVLAFARNITPDDETGIGTWTRDEFLRLMTTGVGPDGVVRSGHMPYSSYASWDSLELNAVYEYIRSIPPIRRQESPDQFVREMASSDPETKGKGIFVSYCQQCHGGEGQGALPTHVVLAQVAPGLSDDELADFISAGNPGLSMPGFGKTFSRNDLHAVVRYIRSWQRNTSGLTGPHP